MFKYLKEHEEDVIAIMVTGKLEKADYDAMIPEMEEKISRFGKVNLYWEMADFEGWKPSGLWQDLSFDAKHANDFKRIALVGDKSWESWMTNLMKPFSSAEIRFFELSQKEQAMTWIQEKSASRTKTV